MTRGLWPDPITLTAQRGYSFQNSRHGAKVGYCPVYHFEKQNN